MSICLYLTKNSKDGEFNVYHPNGIKFISCNILNGKINGQYKEWYYEGQLKILCSYVNGQIDGEYQEFDIRGYTIRQTFYRYNQPGMVIEYD